MSDWDQESVRMHSEAKSRTRGKTVMLVDDDAKLLRGLQRNFAEEDYELLTAVSAAEAKAMLSNHAVDLIVSDNLMSGQLGTDFLADVHKAHPHIKLIILSGYITAAVAQRAMKENGVLEVISKPCNAVEVAAAIRAALEASPGPAV